jgi:methyl coenzyme M reductase subunit D
MEGQEFLDVNQVLQRAVVHENRAKDHISYNWFKENNSKEREKSHVNCVDEESASEDENEVCVAEWVDTQKYKLILCSFLKPNSSKKDEIKYTFDVSKCDKLINVLVRGGGGDDQVVRGPCRPFSWLVG